MDVEIGLDFCDRKLPSSRADGENHGDSRNKKRSSDINSNDVEFGDSESPGRKRQKM